MGDTSSFNERELELLKKNNKEAMRIAQNEQTLQNRSN